MIDMQRLKELQNQIYEAEAAVSDAMCEASEIHDALADMAEEIDDDTEEGAEERHELLDLSEQVEAWADNLSAVGCAPIIFFEPKPTEAAAANEEAAA